MTQRLLRILPTLSLTLAIALLAIWVFSFFHITRLPFTYHEARWQFICRGSVAWVDNEPQRHREITKTSDTECCTRYLWQAGYEKLWRQTYYPLYGAEAAAAPARILAWDTQHGDHWPLQGALPTTPPVTHRVQIIWGILLAVITWTIARRVHRARFGAAPRNIRKPIFRLAIVALCITIGTIWIRSYRRIVYIPIFTSHCSYLGTAADGRLVFGMPRPTDPVKLQALRSLAERLSNDDLDFFIEYQTPDPLHGRPQGSRHAQPWLEISASAGPDTPLYALQQSPDENEATALMLDALTDPDRYRAAHSYLSALSIRDSFAKMHIRMTRDQISMRGYVAPQYDGLNLILTPAQWAATTMTLFDPVVAPDQLREMMISSHQSFDRRSRPIPFYYATSLLLFPIYRIYSAWRQRRRHRANHCASCGYNLTGNISGICPECGTTAPDVAPGATR